MIYLLSYLGVGVILFFINLIWMQLTPQENTRTTIDILDETNREMRSKTRNFVYDVLSWCIFYPVALCCAISVWPVFVYLRIRDWLSPTPPLIERKEFCIEHKDLLQQLTAEEIEARELVFDPLGAAPNLAFGHLNNKWREFLDCKLPEDSIWEFSAVWPDEYGIEDHFEGYVLVNGENIGKHFFTNSYTSVKK